VKTEKIYNKEG